MKKHRIRGETTLNNLKIFQPMYIKYVLSLQTQKIAQSVTIEPDKAKFGNDNSEVTLL